MANNCTAMSEYTPSTTEAKAGKEKQVDKKIHCIRLKIRRRQQSNFLPYVCFYFCPLYIKSFQYVFPRMLMVDVFFRALVEFIEELDYHCNGSPPHFIRVIPKTKIPSSGSPTRKSGSGSGTTTKIWVFLLTCHRLGRPRLGTRQFRERPSTVEQ